MSESMEPMSGPCVLELLVQNHPGVMLHVASLFARRAFNLEGILCGPLKDSTMSRMLLQWVRKFVSTKSCGNWRNSTT